MKKPWPTKAVMQQIYDKHLWGGKSHDFYSGSGSHDTHIITPYLDSVIAFLKSHNNTLVVCDLGCGDFNIGKQLVKYTKNYSAIDIVDTLIERNKTLFKNENLKFDCLNIVEDKLPKGDCIILRQVLQHLSNVEIEKVVEKFSHYNYVIITEHLPIGDFTANKDIISGQGIRLKKNSGVDVLASPFNLKVENEKVISEIVLDDSKGRVLTVLYIL